MTQIDKNNLSFKPLLKWLHNKSWKLKAGFFFFASEWGWRKTMVSTEADDFWPNILFIWYDKKEKSGWRFRKEWWLWGETRESTRKEMKKGIKKNGEWMKEKREDMEKEKKHKTMKAKGGKER